MALSPQPLISLDEALERLLAQATPVPELETVPLLQAAGRVLRAPVVAQLQVPPFDNSAMDGYAVCVSDVPAAGTVLPLSQRIAAGQVGAPLAASTAARIFTGAPVPAGADAVIRQEDVEVQDYGTVRLLVAPQPGQCIRRAGEDIAFGSEVLAAGTRLDAAGLGFAASVGQAVLTVTRRPVVTLLGTGDELVVPGTVPPQALPPGAIYDSNRYFLQVLLQQLGCEVRDGGHLPDDRQATEAALAAAAQDSDLVLTSGGVSVGEEDHVKPAVQALGRLDLWQIAIKPGKPFAYGQLRRTGGGHAHFIGLPGNPVSSLVTFLLLVRPFLLRLQGVQRVQPTVLDLQADFDWPRADARREFLRVRVTSDGRLALFGHQGSGVLGSVVWADGLVEVAPRTPIRRGDRVRYWPLAELGV